MYWVRVRSRTEVSVWSGDVQHRLARRIQGAPHRRRSRGEQLLDEFPRVRRMLNFFQGRQAREASPEEIDPCRVALFG